VQVFGERREAPHRLGIAIRRHSDVNLHCSYVHTGNFEWSVLSGGIFWSDETFRIFECDPLTKPMIDLVIERTHPADRMFVRETLDGRHRSSAVLISSIA
jgi:hypothetical protein